MGFDLDPFADILPEPVNSNARAGAKFQPKAKLRPRRETPVTLPSSLPDATKENSVTKSSNLHDPSKEEHMTPPSRLPGATKSILPVDPAEKGLTHPVLSSIGTSTIRPCSVSATINDPCSKFLGTLELLNSTEASNSGVLLSDDNKRSASVGPSFQLGVTREDMGSTDGLHSGVVASESHEDWESGFERSGAETADIFFELEYLEDFLSQPTTANVSSASKFQPETNVNSQQGNKLLTSLPVTTDAGGTIYTPEESIPHASHTKDLEEGPCLPVLSSVDTLSFREAEAFPGLESLDIISETATASVRGTGKFRPKSKVQTKNEKPSTPFTLPVAVESVLCPRDAPITSETGYVDESLLPVSPPDDLLDFSTIRFCDSSVPIVSTSEVPLSGELSHLAEASSPYAAVPEEVVGSQAVPRMPIEVSSKSRKRKTSTVSEETTRKGHSRKFEELSQRTQAEGPVSAAGEENGAGKSSRQLRKRIAARVPADELEDGTPENEGLLAESSNDSVLDEDEDNDDDDEYRGEDTSPKKRAPRKSKTHAAENEKPVRRRKKASEVPDQLNKEPPKKKFSHSSRRNKRRVDKVLLETPEDEIDPQKLIIKDLILLAEAKERNKEAASLKKSFPNRSADNSFPHDAPNDENGPFSSTHGLNSDDDQANPRVQSSCKVNYHSFMDRTPSERWSKQDTELFYEAIQQFGTDFAMIQQLFPGRTRHQVKLKYKKEERQHPMKLSDALTNRSRDHSHFELVIERLQQAAAQAEVEQNSNIDLESIGVTGEEISPETNEEVAKPERNEEEEEVVTKDEEDVPEVHSPVKSHESEDDLFRWSQYKSEL